VECQLKNITKNITANRGGSTLEQLSGKPFGFYPQAKPFALLVFEHAIRITPRKPLETVQRKVVRGENRAKATV
jgi:hypothetical protein